MASFHVNRAARIKPWARRLTRRPAELSTCSIASARSSGLYGSKYFTASPPTSGSEAAREQMTGVPHAIASRTGKPNPSIFDGITSASAAA